MSEGFRPDRTIIEGSMEGEARRRISSALQPLLDEAGVSAHHTELVELHIEHSAIKVKLRPTPRFSEDES